MMFAALIMRPWMRLMTACSVTPRTLADDLLIFAAGYMHVEKIIDATKKTHDYLQIMGARAATSKSMLFVSTKTARTASDPRSSS